MILLHDSGIFSEFEKITCQKCWNTNKDKVSDMEKNCFLRGIDCSVPCF